MSILSIKLIKSLVLSTLVLSLCNCQTNYRKESLSINDKPPVVANTLKNDLKVSSEDLLADESKALIKYELTDDSSSFCEVIKKEEDCLENEEDSHSK